MTSADDALLDDYQALNDPERRRAVERRRGFFVVEGTLALGALLGSEFHVRSVLAAARRAELVRSLVRGRAPVVVRSDAEVEAITGFRFIGACWRRPTGDRCPR